MKIHNAEMDIKTAGLLMFLADNADSEGVVNMGVREISRRIGEKPMWVSRHIESLISSGLVDNQMLQRGVTEKIASKKILTCCVSISYEILENEQISQKGVTDKSDNLSQEDKERLISESKQKNGEGSTNG